VDHDIVDGAPAARFAQRLNELIEGGYGLEEFSAAPELPGAEAASQQTVNGAHALTQEAAQ
jgi:hypothetical protein